MSDDEPKVYLVNESDAQSIASDIGTFGALVASFWINYEFLGNGFVLQFVLAICFFIAVVGRKRSLVKRMSVPEAVEYFSRPSND